MTMQCLEGLVPCCGKLDQLRAYKESTDVRQLLQSCV